MALGSPPRLEDIQAQTRQRLFGLFVVGRLVLVPAIVTLASWLVLNDSALWRQLTLSIMVLSLLTISLVDVYLFRRQGLRSELTILRNVGAGTVAANLIVFCTGAMDSPAVFLLVVVSLMTVVVVPRLARFVILPLQVVMLWVFALVSVSELVPNIVPDVFGGGARVSSNDVYVWTRTVVMSVVLLFVMALGSRFRRAFDEMLRGFVEKRDETLQMHADRTRDMTLLSGEIAHELKNPLATIKGLSALVAKDLDGKPGERLAVVRREVDRMQSILEEFLNFSRPLVPLRQEDADLTDLCRDVAELHEGVARAAEVRVEVLGHEVVSARCDARKIKQILINLVQNALDASPRGGVVRLEVRERGDQALVRVIDLGPGVSEELEGRAFEPGVTDKDSGSGLGLTVARLLARQHGGDLSLAADSSGTGCVAELTIPSSGAPDDEPGKGGDAS